MNVSGMSSEDKITEMLTRSTKYMPDALQAAWNALLSPENITIMCTTMLLFIVSHMFGVGEVVDGILLLVGTAMMGPAIYKAAKHFLAASECTSAKSEAELENCANELAQGVILLGIDIAMMVLLQRQAKSLKLSRGGPGSSWIRIAKPGSRVTNKYDSGGIGLPGAGPDPQPNAFWSKYSPIKDPSLRPGTGSATLYGEITYSGQGTPDVQDVVLAHEKMHAFLSPKIRPLRAFRAELRGAGYGRSVFLRYLEEMMAEGRGQLATFFESIPLGGWGAGTSVVRHVLRFPIRYGYVTISQFQAEGLAIGTITVGAQVYTVTFFEGPFETIFTRYSELLVDMRKQSVVGSWTFQIPDTKLPSAEQRYAKGWKGFIGFEGQEYSGRCYWSASVTGARHFGNWSVSTNPENAIEEILTFQFDDDDPNPAKRRTFTAVVGNNVCQGNYRNSGWPDGWFRLSR